MTSYRLFAILVTGVVLAGAGWWFVYFLSHTAPTPSSTNTNDFLLSISFDRSSVQVPKTDANTGTVTFNGGDESMVATVQVTSLRTVPTGGLLVEIDADPHATYAFHFPDGVREGSAKNQLRWDVGTLNAGAGKTLSLPFTVKTSEAGNLHFSAVLLKGSQTILTASSTSLTVVQ